MIVAGWISIEGREGGRKRLALGGEKNRFVWGLPPFPLFLSHYAGRVEEEEAAAAGVKCVSVGREEEGREKGREKLKERTAATTEAQCKRG